jgi:hypothetical protein
MKRPKRKEKHSQSTSSLPIESAGFNALLDRLRGIIRQARRQALRAVDIVQVRTGWEMGRHIIEFQQGGAARAKYGAHLLSRLAEKLTP